MAAASGTSVSGQRMAHPARGQRNLARAVLQGDEPPSNATLRPGNGGGASETGGGRGRDREGTPGRSEGTSRGSGGDKAAGRGVRERDSGEVRGGLRGQSRGVPLCPAQAPPSPAPSAVTRVVPTAGVSRLSSRTPGPRVPLRSSRSPPRPPGASRPSVPPIPVSPPPPRRAGPCGLRAGTGPAQHRTGTGTGTGISRGPWRLRQRSPPQSLARSHWSRSALQGPPPTGRPRRPPESPRRSRVASPSPAPACCRSPSADVSQALSWGRCLCLRSPALSLGCLLAPKSSPWGLPPVPSLHRGVAPCPWGPLTLLGSPAGPQPVTLSPKPLILPAPCALSTGPPPAPVGTAVGPQPVPGARRAPEQRVFAGGALRPAGPDGTDGYVGPGAGRSFRRFRRGERGWRDARRAAAAAGAAGRVPALALLDPRAGAGPGQEAPE